MNVNPTPSAVGLTGYDPTYQRVSDFQFNEVASFTSPREN